MTFRLENTFRNIETDWIRLYNATPEVSPFFHVSAFKIQLKYFYPYYLKYRCRPCFGVFEKDNTTHAIVPLLRYKGEKYQLWGFPNGINESGILYDSETDVNSLMSTLKEKLGSVNFLKIDERFILAKHITPPDYIYQQSSNAAISFGNSYDDYFNSLSKSTRQNIRTAYNRVNADGLNLEVSTFHGTDTNLPIKEIISLYCRRHNERYGVKTNILKQWFLIHQSFATRMYRFSPNALTVCLKINGKLAAFLSGLYHNDRLIVPRLSINNEYKRYSPGMLLVCESIKFLISNTSIRVLDLSLGSEKYKYSLGAKEHLSYSFDL